MTPLELRHTFLSTIPARGVTTRSVAQHNARPTRWATFVLALTLAASAVGCATMRGRADDALSRGDYRAAAEMYAKLLEKDPDDAGARKRLVLAEHGIIDQALARVDDARTAGREEDALHAALGALDARDHAHAGSVDDARAARVAAVGTWAGERIHARVEADTARGRALSARATTARFGRWLARPELAPMRPKLEGMIARAGVATCARATAATGEQPFTLALVASYCKAVGAAPPPWRERPLIVSGLALRGRIEGVTSDEHVDLERRLRDALAGSVWFGGASKSVATVDVQGSMVASFTTRPARLTKSWTEQVPYDATEVYSEPVSVPYADTETYTVDVPYDAYEPYSAPCRPPRQGYCNETRRVTKMRQETRVRPVTRFRTQYVERTRIVTRIRDEPRVFAYDAIKHDGLYRASVQIRAAVDPSARPVDSRVQRQEAHTAYEHDAAFAPAGVHPERGTLPASTGFRSAQLAELARSFGSDLDRAWIAQMCGETAISLEAAARCAHARPRPVPSAVRARLTELFGDDPDLVLALPRVREGVVE